MQRGKRTRYLALPLLLLAQLLCGSCVDEEASGLMLTDVVAAVPPGCLIDSRTTNIRTYGVLDVQNNLSNKYYLYPRFINTLFDRQGLTGLKINEENEDYQHNSFRISLMGYKGCISRPQPDDPYRHCDDISDAIPFYYAAGALVEQGGQTTTVVPIDIAAGYTAVSEIPVGGEWWVIRIRGFGRAENGTEALSNEFHFPVLVDNGNLACPIGTTMDDDNICIKFQDYTECLED